MVTGSLKRIFLQFPHLYLRERGKGGREGSKKIGKQEGREERLACLHDVWGSSEGLRGRAPRLAHTRPTRV